MNIFTKDMKGSKKQIIFFFIYTFLFLLGIKTLFHGFPDIERFFAEGRDERISLTYIMKFGTLNFAPTEFQHPPLYHYLTFIPIALFYALGKVVGLFHDKTEFLRFYFNNTHYFFLIGRIISYVFYWLTAVMIYRIIRLFYSRFVSHITALAYLFIPRFIFDFSTTRPETLLFLTSSVFLYFILKYYLGKAKRNLFLAAFFLGVATATKYNALFLGSVFIPLLFFEMKDLAYPGRYFKDLLTISLKIGIFTFLGFFICDPFFVIQFGKYFYNLVLYSGVEMELWNRPAVFFLSHMKEIGILLYMNPFGLLILVLGAWGLFKKEKRLFIIIFCVVVFYEAYFGIYRNNYAPLRYVNPVLPIAALMFGAGVDFIITQRRRLTFILIMFSVVLVYNYFDIWVAMSLGSRYLERARSFIEETVPEFATICITAKSCMPQLNMTEESYYHLMNTAPSVEIAEVQKIPYKEIDRKENYDSSFKQLRIESLIKAPQYNLLRWDEAIRTEDDAVDFLRKNKVEYIIGDIPFIDNERLIDMGIISLTKEFKRGNVTVYGKGSLNLYKVH